MAKKSGFLLIEATIGIALLIIISATTLPFAVTFFRLRAFEEQTDAIISALLTARDQSIAGKNGATFGVKFLPTSYVLFEGASYAARLSAKDITYPLGGGVTANENGLYPNEIAFTNAGKTATGIPITIELKKGPLLRTVIFNSYGAKTASQTIDITTMPLEAIGTLDAYWKMEEISGARYDSADSHDLTPITIDPGFSAQGKIGKALKMTPDAALRNLSGAIGNANRNFTVAGWFNLSSSGNAYLISGVTDQTNALTWTIYYNQSINRFQFIIMDTPNTTVTANSFGAPNIGAWYFIAVSYNASSKIAAISVNNGPLNTATVAGTPQNGAGALTAINGGNDLIDELGIWSKVLTANELTTLYNNGAGTTSPFSGTLGVKTDGFSASDSDILPPVQCKWGNIARVIRYPLSVINAPSSNMAWNAPENALYIDGSVATSSAITATNSPVFTSILQFRNFKNATSNPPNASNANDNFSNLEGITIDLTAIGGINAQDSLMRVVVPANGTNATSSVNKAIGSNVSGNGRTTIRYGGPTDTWGVAWTNNENIAINANDNSFGFDFAAKLNATSSIVLIDGAVMTLCKIVYVDPLFITASQGPKNGTTATNVATIGTVTWQSLNNALSSNDAGAPSSVYLGISNYLKITGFGFSLPSTATVKGIVIEVEKKGSSPYPTDTIADNALRIVKNDNIGSTDKAIADAWPSNDTFISYGSPTDLWGLSWTPDEINNNTFGMAISAKKLAGQMPIASIDSVRITVHYTYPTFPSTGGASLYNATINYIFSFLRYVRNAWYY